MPKLEQFIILTVSFFSIFIFVLPIIFLLIINTHQPDAVSTGIFCVSNNSQIVQGIISHPIHLLNIWDMYFTASADCGPTIYSYYADSMFSLLALLGIQLFISMLLSFLLLKSLPMNKEIKNQFKQRLYLTCFFAVIIFLAIRYIKNSFGAPTLMEFGGDPLVNIIPHYTYPQAVWNAFLYGPNGIMDRTDPQIYTAALYTSVALDIVVSLLGGYLLASIMRLWIKKSIK